MAVMLIGANPMATLMDGGRRVAVVSVWEVDWSAEGAGRALFAWTEGEPAVRLLASERRLGAWLGATFARHFPEFEGLPPIAEPVGCRFTEWRVGTDRVRVEAEGADGSRIAASIGESVATRPAHVRDFPLGEPGWDLSNLLSFCAEAEIELDGEVVEGRPEVSLDGPQSRSTAFVAVHETWTRRDPEAPS